MNKIVYLANKGIRVIKKYSPEIALVTGVIGVGVTAYLASKATLKLESVIDETQENVNTLKEAAEHFETEPLKSDILKVYGMGVVNVSKLYLPTVISGTITISAIIGGYNIMKKRNVVLLASYLAVKTKFDDYKHLVKTSLSEEEYEKITNRYKADIHGIAPEDELLDSIPKNEEADIPEMEYSRIFNNLHQSWSEIPEMNVLFLKAQERLANDLLRSKGVLFLNDVYELMGFDKIPEGQLLGWIIDEYDNVPDIEFGIDWIDYNGPKWSKEDILARVQQGVLLEFNVQGVVHELM